MIPLRSWIIPIGAALVLLAIGVRARADDLPQGVSCPDVRAAIATVAKQTGKTFAEAALIVEAMARAGGATERQVAAAKRCK